MGINSVVKYMDVLDNEDIFLAPRLLKISGNSKDALLAKTDLIEEEGMEFYEGGCRKNYWNSGGSIFGLTSYFHKILEENEFEISSRQRKKRYAFFDGRFGYWK